MTILRRTLTAGSLLAGIAFVIPALAQQIPPAPPAAEAPRPDAPALTPIAGLERSGSITISGTVTDVFGNKFVLEDASGRVLIETGPAWFHQVEIRDGEDLRVIGRPEGGSFEAFTIIKADGTRIEVRPERGPAPWAGGPDRAERDGPRGERRADRDRSRGDDRREERAELDGPRDDNRRAEVGGPRRSGDRGPRHIDPADELPRGEIVTLLEQAGYTDIDDFDRKGRHWEVDADNRFGEEVEVHIDFGGNIYKEERD